YDGRDQTFFFFSYEGLQLRLPQTKVASVPSLRIRQLAAESVRPLLDALPLPTGPEFLNSQSRPTGTAPLIASWSDPSKLDALSIRIDHIVNQKLTAFGRYNDAPSKNITRSSSTLNM